MTDRSAPIPGRGAKTRRVGFISLGCAKNLLDTEVMLGHLGEAGWELVQDPAEADVIVVNTCSFIGPAREESIQTILEAAEYKKTGRLQRLVVAGCMVQRNADELRLNLPEIDDFVDLDELPHIVARVSGSRTATPAQSALPVVSASAPSRASADPELGRKSASTYLYDDRTPRVRSTPPWTAYLKIAEGCDHTCSFCAIPGFRGRFRSRTAESILAEAGRLVDEGVRELNLIAQDTSHYGRDLGLGEGLADLVERFDEIDALRWVRLHYLYPNTITPKLIRAMARSKRVVDYVDMPLQHAHPAMLRRMRRGGSAESHLRLLARFREAMPDVALRTTLIVGFPGETDREYEALLDFVREARFDHLGVFLYSHERDTAAFELSDDVPGALKQERHDRLMECQQSIAFERNSAMLGRTVEVLVEGAHEETEHLLVGRTARQAPDVDGQILIHEGQAAPGEFVQVELRETAGYDVVGGIVETRPPAGATG